MVKIEPVMVKFALNVKKTWIHSGLQNFLKSDSTQPSFHQNRKAKRSLMNWQFKAKIHLNIDIVDNKIWAIMTVNRQALISSD